MCERDRERHTCTETEMLADSISFCQLSVVTRPKLHFTNFIPSWLGRNSAETSQQDLFSVSFKSSLQTQICHFFFSKIRSHLISCHQNGLPSEATVTVYPHYEDNGAIFCGLGVSDELSVEELVRGEENDSLCCSIIE